MKLPISQSLVAAALFILAACDGSGSDSTTSTRSFHMGFTPWPYDATVAATSNTYSLVQNNGDIISHHLMSGIPWEEAYNETALPAGVENDLTSRLNQTLAETVIFLSIDSLNTARDGLALNWGDGGEEPRPSPWDGRGFADAEVAEAYSRFALDMIDRFDPAYFNYAPEISELMLNDPGKFDAFATFAETVYQAIKAEHPDLPLMVSIALKSPDSADALTIRTQFADIADYVDMVGVSVYPYAFYTHNDKGDPANMPADWLGQILAIAGDKPVAITETGWIAEDLTISGYGYAEQSDAEKQKAYVSTLMAVAEDLSLEFVIWFAIVDYDALWNGVLGQDDLSKLWKDTGLYDENLNARPGLGVWQRYYSKSKTGGG